MLVVAMKKEEVVFDNVVKELEMEHYLSELVSYYFSSAYSKFQDGLVIFCSGVVDTK